MDDGIILENSTVTASVIDNRSPGVGISSIGGPVIINSSVVTTAGISGKSIKIQGSTLNANGGFGVFSETDLIVSYSKINAASDKYEPIMAGVSDKYQLYLSAIGTPSKDIPYQSFSMANLLYTTVPAKLH